MTNKNDQNVAHVDTKAESSSSRTATTNEVPSATVPLNRVSPLPWTWQPCETEGPIGDDDVIAGAQLIDSAGKSVFTEDCGDYRGLNDENALYIFRACNAYPELLAALKLAEKHVQLAFARNPQMSRHAADLAQVRAAIARAEGLKAHV